MCLQSIMETDIHVHYGMVHYTEEGRMPHSTIIWSAWTKSTDRETAV